MITKTINTELGSYKQKINHGHKVNYNYTCIESYKDVENPKLWSNCPCCNLKPRIWAYNNGLKTGCGCGNSIYDHFSVFAESIMSVHKRCGGIVAEYERDNLMVNWNEYCATMINPCSYDDLRVEGKW